MAHGAWRISESADPKSKIQNLKSGWLEAIGPAETGTETEVVIAVGPAFGVAIQEAISGLALRDVLGAMLEGIAEEGVPARIVRVHHTSDCAFIGHAGAQLSGSGVAIGIQSKGTTVIHQRDLAPLENLELFSMAPNMTLETYRQIGRNAARYALRKPTSPAPVKIDNTARLRLIVQTTLLHHRETEMVEEKVPTELRFDR
ncbi:MAG: glycerol dehydratase reactivase beta/small subunit family protein [Anaerolineae bacterium]